MKWREMVQAYLRFSRKDRIGSIVILCCILVIYLLPNFLPEKRIQAVPLDDSSFFIAEKRGAKQVSDWNNERENHYSPVEKNYSLFYFDPNELSRAQWALLGLREKTINTILNYRGKGGHFKKPEDLKKIYGLRKEEYERLKDYVRITSEASPEKPKELFESNKKWEDRTAINYQSNLVIDINAADTAAWIALPGIGSKLASRIVNFREKLGGFYAVEQVAETFGLRDSTFQQIKRFLRISANFKKININTATVEELKTHPYIRWQLANAIIAYRNEHGPFHSAEDIKQIMSITEDVYRKLLPYLNFDL